MIFLIILFSNQKSKAEKEILSILQNCGASFISAKKIDITSTNFFVFTIYKKTELSLEKGMAVFLENSVKFYEQKLPIGVIGVCEEDNRCAYKILKKNHNAVITCGINSKNSITFSSISQNGCLVTLQRAFCDLYGNLVEPCEFKINLTKKYMPFSIMIAATILLYHGITPYEF